MTFGRWLSAQKDRCDWIGDLARAAARDRRFPWRGEPADMHDRIAAAMNRAGSDAEPLHAFRAALDEWHGQPYPLGQDFAQRRERERLRRIEAGAAQIREDDRRRARNARDRARYAERKRGAG